MKKKYYTARWAQAGHASTANVSFYASHNTNAKRQADKIARELGVTKTPRTITCEGKTVETLTTGIS